METFSIAIFYEKSSTKFFDFVQIFAISTVNATTKTLQRNARLLAILLVWSKIGKITNENVPYEILSTIIVCK